MKGRWESNITVWFPFMYSQKWNCAASLFPKQNYNMVCLPIPIHSYICERFIYFQDWSVYIAAAKYVDRSWEYINRSQTKKKKEIGTEAAQFPEKEYINGIFVAVYLLCWCCQGVCGPCVPPVGIGWQHLLCWCCLGVCEPCVPPVGRGRGRPGRSCRWCRDGVATRRTARRGTAVLPSPAVIPALNNKQ